jgi:hydroxyacyl-ACP dehydratase HTD2-like protein with hotdog domain
LGTLEAAVGWVGDTRVDVVERRHLRFFRDAIGMPPDDSDDVHVPATICACFLPEPPTMEAAYAYGSGWLNGGDRFEYLSPLHLGDELHSHSELVGVTEKHGRSGTMALLTFVTEFRRPTGELMVRHVGTRIRR